MTLNGLLKARLEHGPTPTNMNEEQPTSYEYATPSESLQTEQLEYEQALKDIRAIASTTSGINFLKYLFKTLGVAELPEQGLPDKLMYENLGHLRAGKAVFELVSVANPDIAAAIIARLEKERHAKAIHTPEI